jgi:hypothetical protein
VGINADEGKSAISASQSARDLSAAGSRMDLVDMLAPQIDWTNSQVHPPP